MKRKPLLSPVLFLIALFGAWKFSSFNQDGKMALSSTSPVRINECELQEKTHIQASPFIKNLVEKTWQEKVVKFSAICKKWTENNEVFYIALYYLKNDQGDETAFLALFEKANTIQAKPVWVFESFEEPSLLERGLYTINNNGHEEVLALADLNQDQRPEIIFATDNGRTANLYAFQLDYRRKQLVPLTLKQNIMGTIMNDASVIISMEQRPVAHIRRDGVASTILTKDSTLTAEKDQWIKVDRK